MCTSHFLSQSVEATQVLHSVVAGIPGYPQLPTTPPSAPSKPATLCGTPVLHSMVKGGSIMTVPMPTEPQLPDDGGGNGAATDKTSPQDPTEVQRLFGPHEANVQRLRDRYGTDLAAMDVGELLAMPSSITDQLAAVSAEAPAASRASNDETLSPAALSRTAA